jgi:hypothetical protein
MKVLKHTFPLTIVPGYQSNGMVFKCLMYVCLSTIGPILYLFSPKKAAAMAVTAGNGGLIPWQAGIATRIGRFQFILGREVGVSLYGLNTPVQAILIPVADKRFTLVSYKSTELDFPILEYQPFRRSFSQVQSSSFLVQLTGGVNIPHGATVINPIQP